MTVFPYLFGTQSVTQAKPSKKYPWMQERQIEPSASLQSSHGEIHEEHIFKALFFHNLLLAGQLSSQVLLNK